MNFQEISISQTRDDERGEPKIENKKPLFRPAEDDTKPVLRDPILRSDPIESEEAVLRLPNFPIALTKNRL